MHWRTTKKCCIEKTVVHVDEVPAAAEGKVTLRRDGVVLPIGCPEESDRISGVRYSMDSYEDSRSLL